MGNPIRTAGILVLTAAVSLCSLSDALGALAHRYSFTTNANDSVGTAHGTVIDVGAPTAVFAGGQLDLSANTGQGSNVITEDAFVDLPNGIISGISSSGVSGAFSMEVWATVAETHTWQRFIDVGTSNGGENVSNGGGDTPYIYIAANSGRFADGVSTEIHAPPPPPPPLREVGQAGPLPTGVQLHIVGTYDQNETTAARPNGTFRLYRDGILLGTGALPPNMPLNTFTNNNNWLGRSQWNDPVFDGQFNEVRLYSHALTASEVGTNTFSGPDSLVSLLALSVNTTTGAVTLTNNATTALVADFYRVTSSAENALSVAGWNSLDEQNYDAVDGPDGGTVAGDSPTEGWDQGGGSSAGQLLEYFLGETGSTIGPGETLSLGNAYNPAVGGTSSDLQFSLGLLSGIEINGSVTYVGGGIPGDFNNDGAVNAADYVVWRKSIGTQEGYNLWRTNFGRTSGSGSGVGGPIPEPSLLAMLVAVAAVGLLARRT
jgi:concanavalin A-like lectin/glucanase superfamily protein